MDSLYCLAHQGVERPLFSLYPVVVHCQPDRGGIDRILSREFQFLPGETPKRLAKTYTNLDAIHTSAIIYASLSQHLGSSTMGTY